MGFYLSSLEPRLKVIRLLRWRIWLTNISIPENSGVRLRCLPGRRRDKPKANNICLRCSLPSPLFTSLAFFSWVTIQSKSPCNPSPCLRTPTAPLPRKRLRPSGCWVFSIRLVLSLRHANMTADLHKSIALAFFSAESGFTVIRWWNALASEKGKAEWTETRAERARESDSERPIDGEKESGLEND